MDTPRPVAVIPTYNNENSVAGVVEAVRVHVPDIIVVNDGSTDGTAERLAGLSNLDAITLEHNGGKGVALRKGFEQARRRGFTHAITIDADGQHIAGDIPSLLEAMAREPQTLWIGNRVLPADGDRQPPRSRFGARFGAFWFRFHTRLRIDDTQCGLRVYPLEQIAPLPCRLSRYDYELDILIRAAWSGIPVRQMPVHLFYQPRDRRVSHFRPVVDFLRISRVNSRAAVIRIFMPWRFIDAPGETVTAKLRFLFVKELTSVHSPSRAAFAISLGAFIGILPIHGIQVVLTIVLSLLFRLNRPLALLGVAISSWPVLPFWIAAGYAVGTYVLPSAMVLGWWHGIGKYALWAIQWFFGSIVLAVVVAVLIYLVTYPLFVWFDYARGRSRGDQTRAIRSGDGRKVES